MTRPASTESAARVSAARGSWLLPALIVVCATGAGVTGTLLWMQSRPALQSRPTPILPSVPEQKGALVSRVLSDAPVPDDVEERPALQQPPAALATGLTPAQAALTQGNWHYDHEQWPLALAQYQKAITSGVDNPDVRTDLGNCYRFTGQPQKALEQYRRAQKQNPQHEQSLFNQAGVYASQSQQLEKAIALWRQYLQRFPNGQSVAEARQLIAEAEAHLTSHPAGR